MHVLLDLGYLNREVKSGKCLNNCVILERVEWHVIVCICDQGPVQQSYRSKVLELPQEYSRCTQLMMTIKKHGDIYVVWGYTLETCEILMQV